MLPLEKKKEELLQLSVKNFADTQCTTRIKSTNSRRRIHLILYYYISIVFSVNAADG